MWAAVRRWVAARPIAAASEFVAHRRLRRDVRVPQQPVRRGCYCEQLNQQGDTLFELRITMTLDIYTRRFNSSRSPRLTITSDGFTTIVKITTQRSLLAASRAAKFDLCGSRSMSWQYTYRSLKRYDDAFFAYRRAILDRSNFRKSVLWNRLDL
jgi:hypothetical protein